MRSACAIGRARATDSCVVSGLIVTMTTHVVAYLRLDHSRASNCVLFLLTAAVRFLWLLVRPPTHALLIVLEPVVRWMLSLALVLGVLAAAVFEVSAVGAQFEFLLLFVGSLGYGVALFLYYSLLALVSRLEA